MKVLFVTAKEATDHLATCIYDGLQEVLGEANVVDAVGHRCLHAGMCAETPLSVNDDPFSGPDVLTSIGGRRMGRVLEEGERDFDLLVLNAAFLREWDWDWAKQAYARLRPWAKVVYVEGWDSAHEVHAPEDHVDAVFRKEIDPGFAYPYSCRHLTFAFPSRWARGGDDRPRDVFYSGTAHSHPLRQAALGGVFLARTTHYSVVASGHLGVSVRDYFDRYLHSKIALCPASAESADSLRTYEAVSQGCVPLFVGYPPWVREDWFEGKAFFCSWNPQDVAAHVDAALGRDLGAMRAELMDLALRHHTTRARAEKLLRAVS